MKSTGQAKHVTMGQKIGRFFKLAGISVASGIALVGSYLYVDQVFGGKMSAVISKLSASNGVRYALPTGTLAKWREGKLSPETAAIIERSEEVRKAGKAALAAHDVLVDKTEPKIVWVEGVVGKDGQEIVVGHRPPESPFGSSVITVPAPQPK